jgi:purine nucleoside phosphorylase
LKTCRLILIGHRILSPGHSVKIPVENSRFVLPHFKSPRPWGLSAFLNPAEAVRVCLSGTGRKERAHQHLILEPPRDEVRQPPMMGVRTLVVTKRVGGGVLLSSWVQLIANTQPRGSAGR